MSNWKDDAHFVGAFVRGGSWEVGLRIARRVQADKGRGGRNEAAVTNRVSEREFATEAGIAVRTVGRYLDAWEKAAADGKVDPAIELAPEDEYDWAQGEFTQAQWDQYYASARYGDTGGSKRPPTKREIADAIKEDPDARLAAIEAIEEAEQAADRSRGQDKFPGGDKPVDDLVSVSVAVRKAKRALQELLGKVVDFKDYPDGRDIIREYVEELQKYLDAIGQVAQGDSMDAELEKLLEGGVR